MSTDTESLDAVAYAAKLNAHLESGGVVQVTTYLRSTIYDGPKYAGWFTASGDSLFVRRGKGRDCINGVSIRIGRWK